MDSADNLLCIDVGNTRSKAAVYGDGGLLAFAEGDDLDIGRLTEWKHRFGLQHAMLSAVAEDERLPVPVLRTLFSLHFPKDACGLPFRIAYRTPETLGADRLACMAAAASLFPQRPSLVLQCGTCLTIDYLTSDALYAGGSISPGLQMRFRSLKEFTARLPLACADPNAALYGDSTLSSIQSGVLQGYLSECAGMIQKYKAINEHLMVIVTGGDAAFVKDNLEMTIFVFPNLVLYGLMLMLRYDIEK